VVDTLSQGRSATSHIKFAELDEKCAVWLRRMPSGNCQNNPLISSWAELGLRAIVSSF
ncbi:hypothetical protein H4Q26_010953, partial [Puccinia striiformis f. sp. tritici PST-130]